MPVCVILSLHSDQQVLVSSHTTVRTVLIQTLDRPHQIGWWWGELWGGWETN